MQRFRPDNTAGYDIADLVALNAAFAAVLATGDISDTVEGDPSLASLHDHLAGNLLARYDGGLRGDALVTAVCQGR